MEWLSAHPLLPEKLDVEFYADEGSYHDARDQAWPVEFIQCARCGLLIMRLIHPTFIMAERCEPDRCLDCAFELEDRERMP